MSFRNLQRWLAVGAMLALPVMAHAQEVTLLGTVTDNTGGALPGVTVVAVHEASGNTFETVTDGSGQFQILGRVGAYQLTADLPGFTSATRSATLLLGQEAVIDMQLSVGGVQETITVTGEAPLLDVTSSSMASNIDPRQMQELPIQGRDWVQLIMLAPGARVNGINAGTPTDAGNERGGSYSSRAGGNFQITVDGQSVTQLATGAVTTSKGQPRVSRDAMAEFEFQSSRFDATQGRSTGMQINAVTKSGTNTMAGSFSGYFRDDALNGKDKIRGEVLPYQNQQLSGTLGGPILRDKVHFFANYEYEREPQTLSYLSPFPSFNIDVEAIRTVKMAGARGDVQFTPASRMSVRYAKSTFLLPISSATEGGNNHPSRQMDTRRFSNDVGSTFTQVLGGATVNEIRAGWNDFHWTEINVVNWPGGPTERHGFGPVGSPIIQFRGYTIGQANSLTPQRLSHDAYSVRDDFTTSYSWGGRHDLKIGGDYTLVKFDQFLCFRCVGILDLRGGPIPANIEELFPVWNDVATWNLAPLSSIARRYTQGIGDFTALQDRNVFAGWVQDDWHVSDRLTLNLGLRYDFATGLFAEDVELLPFIRGGRPNDSNNVGPRLGFAYSAGDRTVIRGGFGRYFGEVTDQLSWSSRINAKIMQVEVLNDGRPDFASNPYNGPEPTFDQAVAQWNAGELTRTIPFSAGDPKAQVPYSWQASAGVQRQLGDTMSVQADYVFSGTRHERTIRDQNVIFDPETGANLPFTAGIRPFAGWGTVGSAPTDQWNNYHALQTAFTKRFSGRWQASGTYTMSRDYQGNPLPISTVGAGGSGTTCEHPFSAPGVCDVPITLAKDMGGDPYWTGYTHRGTFNGIWDMGYGFQLSGLYFYRNGIQVQSVYGGDLRRMGRSTNRLRPDGSIVPRNNFTENALHRMDVRLSRRTGLGVGNSSIDVMLEVFNLLNHENFGRYVTAEVARNFGQPLQNTNIAYLPRVVQLGFKFSF
jgi:hypothetical protein